MATSNPTPFEQNPGVQQNPLMSDFIVHISFPAPILRNGYQNVLSASERGLFYACTYVIHEGGKST